jgi:hypothetical protein
VPTVLIDNTGQSAGGTSTASLSISSFPVGPGANRCIKLDVEQYNNPDLAPSAVFDSTGANVAFTVHDSLTIAEGAGTRRVTTLKLLNPPNDTKDIKVTWGGTVAEAVIGATSWSVVDQTNGFGTAVKNSGFGTSSSVSIPNATGDVVHDAISADAAGSAGVTANQTQRYRAIAASFTTEGAGQSADGTGSNISCQWSNINGGGGGVFTHMGVAILQAAGGGAAAPIGFDPRTKSPPGMRGPRDRLGFLRRQVWDYTIPPAPTGYTLTADQGSYVLTGQVAAVRAARDISAAQGSYALTGNAAGLAVGRKVTAAQGSYVLSGQAAALRVARALALAQGAYAVTGQPTTLRIGHRLTAASGAYTLTGEDANLLYSGFNKLISAAQGAYVLTGQAAALRAARRLAMAQGAYALTGQAAVLRAGHRIIVVSGTFALSGQSATLRAGRKLGAVSGAYGLTGNPATLRYGSVIRLATGVYVLTGFDAVFIGGAQAVLVPAPLYVDFASLATSIEFPDFTTWTEFDDLETRAVFLTVTGDEIMGSLKLFEGEVVDVVFVLRGAGGVAQDLSSVSTVKWTVGKPDAAPIVNAATLEVQAPATLGAVKYPKNAALTLAGGKYKALAVATFPGSPPIVRKFPGEVIIEDAIA